MSNSRVSTRRIGFLIPSSNTVVETEAQKLIPNDGSVSLHFSRLAVTTISADADSAIQFETEAMVKAALLLADAKVEKIAWAGTAASWLGMERDISFKEDVESRCGISTTTAVLAINQRLSDMKARKLGLVTPYIAALENQIIDNYRAMGLVTIASRRLDLTVNTDYAKVSEDQVADMVFDVARAKPDAIVIMCTNLRFGLRARSFQQELGVSIIDSVAAIVADSM